MQHCSADKEFTPGSPPPARRTAPRHRGIAIWHRKRNATAGYRHGALSRAGVPCGPDVLQT